MTLSISGLIDSYCAFRSTNGMLMVVSSVCMILLASRASAVSAAGRAQKSDSNLSAGNEVVRKLGNLTRDTGGIADDNGACRNVAHDDGAGADERALTDRHSGQEGHVGADDGALADDGTDQTVFHTGRHRILRVREHDVRTDPAPFLEHRVLGDEHLGVNPDVV